MLRKDTTPLPNLATFLAAFASSISMLSAHAQYSETEFSALIKAGNRAGVEALAKERLAKNAKDDVALWFYARVFAGDASKRDELVKRAEQCVVDLPKSARCHSAVGSLYGAMAMSGGMTSAMKYVGKIKDSMQSAVDLDPKSFDMRRDLIQFYLQAPGIAGGSNRRAMENADAFVKIDATRGQILRAEVLANEKKFDRAEAALLALKPSEADSVDAVFNAMNTLGFGMINGDEAPRAQKLFERQIAARMGNATAHFGMGRALLEQKNTDAAIASMERALQLEPKLNVHYRLGIAYQIKGDKSKAIASLDQFLTTTTSGRMADDARKRLSDLKRS
jgi:tetratricopeptide (TPR) repeat protein